MHLLEGARARALLLDARDAGGLAHHAALADENDVAIRKLLLELAGEAFEGESRRRGGGADAGRREVESAVCPYEQRFPLLLVCLIVHSITSSVRYRPSPPSSQLVVEKIASSPKRLDLPTLDLVERLDLGDGDEDDDRLLATLDIDLAGSRDLERAELSLEVGHVVLEVEESLGDEELGRVGGGLGSVGRAKDLGGGGGHAGRGGRTRASQVRRRFAESNKSN